MSRAQFLAVVLTGLLLRAIALPGPGTGDLTVFKVWTYNAARHGVADMYGTGGPADEWHPLDYAGVVGYVVYPPLVLYELGASGQLYWLWSHHHFPNTVALNAFVKLPAFFAEIGLALLLFLLTRERLGTVVARLSASAYWLNPAALVNASVLGYLDAQFALPAVAAVAAGALGWPTMAGGLVAASILTKPQGLFVAPAVALALWTAGPSNRRLQRFAWAIARRIDTHGNRHSDRSRSPAVSHTCCLRWAVARITTWCRPTHAICGGSLATCCACATRRRTSASARRSPRLRRFLVSLASSKSATPIR